METFTYDEIKSLIQQHEGIHSTAYKDSKGIWTVGIGFNLERPDARAIFKQLNLDYDKVFKQQVSLTPEQIVALFTVSLKIATQDAKKFMPGFDTLPKNVKMVLVDLSFNLGYSRLSKFVKTKQFIEQGNFKEAAQELLRSKWATQVGNRAKNLCQLLSSAGPSSFSAISPKPHSPDQGQYQVSPPL